MLDHTAPRGLQYPWGSCTVPRQGYIIPQGGDASWEALVSPRKRPETSEALLKDCPKASRNPPTEGGLEALSTQSLTLQAFPLCSLFTAPYLLGFTLFEHLLPTPLPLLWYLRVFSEIVSRISL